MHNGDQDGPKHNNRELRFGTQRTAAPILALHFRQGPVETIHVLAKMIRKAIEKFQAHLVENNFHHLGHEFDACFGHINGRQSIVGAHRTILLKLNFFETVLKSQVAVQFNETLLFHQ